MSPAKKIVPSVKVFARSRTFDARPDRLDFRDLPYRPPLQSLPSHFPKEADLKALLPGYVQAGLILDQGTEGACTGFGLACVINHMLFRRHVSSRATTAFPSASPRMLYELAKRYDEWPGESYDGSSCRGALKGWHKHGVCSLSMWPYMLNPNGTAVFTPPHSGWEIDAMSRTVGVYYRVDRSSVVDIQAALLDIGAVYVSGRVHSGWDALANSTKTTAPLSHSAVPDIAPSRKGDPLFGHAFALVGYDERGFIVQNSWGETWGAGGFARLAYADWVAHGTDAWVCALGVPAVPSKALVDGVRWKQPAGRSLTRLERSSASRSDLSSDPWPIKHEFQFKPYEPISMAEAYSRSLVTGNNGVVAVRDVTKGGPNARAEAVREVVFANPLAWFTGPKKGPVAKLAIYAHGGLNDEDGSIARVRVLAPYFIANGIYPLFLVWRTGALETIESLVEDWVRRIPGFGTERDEGVGEWISDQKDRAIEVVARPLGRGIWSEMHDNALGGMIEGHGVDLLATNLNLLGSALTEKKKALEVHLIGHSAGAILHGRLLQELTRRNATSLLTYSLGSCSLLAPACSVAFANESFIPASNAGILPLKKLWLHCLDDSNEKRDALPSPNTPLYGKSLLYLVSRSLDERRKEPILGLERAHLPKYANDADQWADTELTAVKEWQKEWSASGGAKSRTEIVATESVRCSRTGAQVQATHGSFDNNITVFSDIIERVASAKLVSEIEWLDY